MNCPDCKTQVSAGQQFCRECGAELRADESRPFAPSPILGLLLAFGGVIVALTGKMLFQSDVVTYIGVVMSILGMMTIALIPMLAAKRTGDRRRRPTAKPASMAPAEPTMKLPPMNAADHIPSVVDNTTQLLKEPAQPSAKNRQSSPGM